MKGTAVRAALALLIPVVACEPPDGPASQQRPASQVRDSAGVEIVESFRPAWDDNEGWHLSGRRVFQIQGGTEEGQLLDPASIDVDARGRVIIADGLEFGWDAIMVYDSVGQFLFKAGGPGEGPGEFGQLWWASTYRADSIVGFDMSGDELAVFTPEGKFGRQIRTPPFENPSPPTGTYAFTNGMDAAFGDGHFLAYPRGTLNIDGGPGPAWYEHTLMRLHPDGEAWDTLGTFPIASQYWNGEAQESLWFGPYAVKATDVDRLYYGRGDTFQVHRYGPNGQLDRIMRRYYELQPVTDESKELLKQWYLERIASSPEGSEAAVARVTAAIETGEFAENLPSYSHMILDDTGHLWVEEFRWFGVEQSPVDRPTQWSVFDSTGIWLGNVEVPPGLIVREVSENYVLGIVVDDMDVKKVNAYTLYR